MPLKNDFATISFSHRRCDITLHSAIVNSASFSFNKLLFPFIDHKMGYTEKDWLAINTIRTLAVSVFSTLAPRHFLPHWRFKAFNSPQLLLLPILVTSMDSIANCILYPGRCDVQSKLRPSRSTHGPCTYCSCPLQQIHDL